MALARVFLGVAPDRDLRKQLDRLVGRPSGRHVGLKPDPQSWAHVDDLHVTLVFIGNAAPELVAGLHERIEGLGPQLTPFDYELHGPVQFPDARRPRVLALVPHDPSGFAAWQAPLAGECAAAGFRLESRPYRPHLSLARLKSAPREAFAPVQGLRGTAREIVLFESRGGHYQPLFQVRVGMRAA